MNTGRAIRRILFISMWLVIGAGMVTLLAAAMHKQKNDRCRDYHISIKGKQDHFFADEKDIQQILTEATNGKIKGQLLSSFNLHQIEGLLKDNLWIREADLYFDNRDVLHVTITEKEPIARIFTTEGSSYYLDDDAGRMPVSGKLSARVPVFTGFPEKKVLTYKDSLLLRDVRTTAQFILHDPFWMAQVSQIDITADRTFEMIPVIGNHVVKLGDGENIDKKFHRLFVFYIQVLNKTGFEKYKTIDVQYAGQVIGSKQPGRMKVDSAQLRKNVEKLLRRARDQEKDSVVSGKAAAEKLMQKDGLAGTTDLNATAPEDGIKPSDPNPLKSTLSIPAGKTASEQKPVKEKKEPRAVMPKRNE